MSEAAEPRSVLPRAWRRRVLLLSFSLLGCGSASARAPATAASPAALPACAAALPGTRCQMTVTDGDPPVVTDCTRQPDGTLACDER